MKRSKLNTPIFVGLLLLIAQNQSFSQTFDNGGGDNLWSNPTNWNPDGLPGAGASVTISGYTVIVNSNETVTNVTINADAASNTELDIQAGGNLTVTNDLNVNVVDENTNTDVTIQGGGILTVNNDVIFDRDVTNTRNRRLRLTIEDNSDMNVGNDFTFTYGDGTENGVDILVQNSANFDITGNFTMEEIGDGNDITMQILNTAAVTVGGDFSMNQTDGNNVVLDLQNDGSLTVTDDFQMNIDDDDNNTRVDLDDNAVLNVSDSVIIVINDGNNVTWVINDNSDVNITNAFYFDKNGGEDFELDMNDNATIDIGGALVMDIVGDDNNDVLLLDLNGGTLTTDSTALSSGATSTSNTFLRVRIDGATFNTGGFSMSQDGGDAGDFDLLINDASTAAASVFNCTGDFLWQHTDGDNMEIEVNENATMTVTGTSTYSMTSSTDNDNFYFDINNGTVTLNGLVTFSKGAGVTADSDIDFRMDGGILNMNGGVLFDSDGGDEDLFYFNTNSTAIAADVNITGDVTFDHDGGDNTGFYVYGNTDVDITGNIVYDLNGSDGDNVTMHLRGTSGTLDITDLNYSASGGAENSGEDLDIYIDDNFVFTMDDMFLDMNTGSNVELWCDQNSLGNSGTLNIQDSLIIDHETLAADFYLRNSPNGNNSNIFIGTVSVDWEADGGDLIRFENSGTNDSIVVTNNIDVTMNGGTLNTDDDIRFDINTGVFNVGGSINAIINAGDGIQYLVDDAQSTVTGNLLLEADGGRFITFDIDGSTQNIGDSLILRGLSAAGGGDITFRVNEGAVLNITRSAYVDFNGGDDYLCYIGTAATDDGKVNIGEDYNLNHGAAADNMNNYLYNNSRLDITRDWIVTHTAATGIAGIILEMEASNDSLTIGNDFNWSMNGGVVASDDDLTVNMYGGYFSVGGDLLATSTQGSEFNFLSDGGVVDITGGAFVNWQNSNTVNFRFDNTSSNIGTDLSVINNAGNQVNINTLSGTQTVGRDLIVDLDNCTGNYTFNQDGGDFTVTEDVLLTVDGANATNFYIDDANFTIGDSLHADLNTQSDLFRFYVGNTSGPASATIDDFYIDHETTAHDVLIRTDNDGKIVINNSLVADHDADGGDYFELELENANDTITIGGDLIASLTAGSNDGDDDLRVDINAAARLTVGGDVNFSMTNDGAGALWLQSDGDVDITGGIYFNVDDSREIDFDIDGGTLDVGTDIDIYHGTTNNTNNFNWDQDGGTVTVTEDFLLQINGNDASYFHLDNAAVLNVTDSIYIDVDLSNAQFEWYLNNNTGSGALITADNIYVDHEGAGQDFRVLLNGDANIEVTNNFRFDHDALNGDYIEIQLNQLTDSLIIGNDLIYNVIGSGNNGDDAYLDAHGYVSIGNDFLVDMTDGAGLRLEQTSGEITIGRYFTWTQTNSQELFIQTYDATLTVGDDMTLNWNGVDPYDMDWNADLADINLNQDFYFNKTGGRESDFRYDSLTTFDIADSVYFNLDASTSRNYIQIGNNRQGASTVNVGSHIYVDHEQDAGDFYLQLNNDARLNVTNSIVIDHDAANGDVAEINLSSSDDTLVVGDDIIMRMPSSLTGDADDDLRFDVDGGYVSVGQDLILDIQNGGGDVRYQQLAGDVDVSRYMMLLNSGGGRELDTDIDGGTLDVGDDLFFTHDSEQADFDAHWDQDGGTVTLAQDMYVTINDNDFTNIDLDNGSVLAINDSLLLDLDVSTQSFRIDLDNESGSGSRLSVGSHLYIDHESTYEDVYITTNNDSRIDVGVDLTAVFDADVGTLELEMNASNDTVIIGNDLLFNMLSGTDNAQSDNFIDINAGRFSVGRDVIMTQVNGDAMRFDHADGDADIGRYLTMTSTSSGTQVITNDAGTLDVGDDVTISHINSDAPSNFTADINGGDITFNEDLYFTVNGTNEANWYLDGSYNFNITDSVFFDLDLTNGITRLYLNDDAGAGSGGNMSIGTHFYLDHEATAEDFLLRIDNDARLDIGTDLTIITDADGGDYARIDMETANDTLTIGRDLLMTMTSGSLNADDDLLIDNSGGRISVGRDVIMTNRGGGSVRFDHTTGSTQDTDIGRYLTLISTNARDMGMNIDGGNIDVVDDITVTHTGGAGYNVDWDQDGGTVTTNEDMYLNIDGTNQANFYLSNSTWVIADTLFMNHDASDNIFRVEAYDGGLLDVNNDIVVDHEAAGADVRLRTNTDGTIDVADNIHFYHDAAGGDYAQILMSDADDTLLVGNDIEMIMSSGATTDDDDLIIELNGGYADVGNDVLFTGTAGTDLELRVYDGNVNIGRFLTMDGDNIDDIITDIDAGSITVVDDVTLTLNASDNIITHYDGGTFNANQDFIIIMDGSSNDLNWRSTNASVVNVADSIFFDLNDLDFASIYFNDDGTTGSALNVGNDFVIDHEATGGDVLVRLDGDAMLNVTDNFDIYHDALSGDYFELDLEENDGTDTVLIGGEMNIMLLSGNRGSDDDIRIDQNGGLIEVTGDVNLTANTGDDIAVDLSSGSFNALSDLNITITDADDATFEQQGLGTHILDVTGNTTFTGLRSDLLRLRFGGTSADLNGNLTFDSDDTPLTGTAILDIDGGTNNVVGVTTITVNDALDAGDAEIDIDGGTNVFQSNVIMNVTNVSDNALFEVAGTSNTTLQDSLVINVNTGSDNVQFDIDAGTLTITEDVVITHDDARDFLFDQDGGTFTVDEDFFHNANNIRRTQTYIDGLGTSYNVADSVIFNLDVTTDYFYFMLDNNVDGSEATVGTFYVDHEATAQDVLVRLAGDATFTVQNDMHFDHDALTGDYLEVEILGAGDSLLIGRDLFMDHMGGNGNGDDLRFDMNDGYASIGEDMYMTYNGSGTADNDVELTLDESAYITIGDSLFMDLNNNDDLFFYFNTAAGNDARLYAEYVVIDKEADADDSRIRMNGSNSRLDVNTDFTITMDGNTGDFFEIDINGTQDSIVVGNDFFIQYNNSNTGNGNSDMRVDMEGGVIHVANDFEINFVSGNDVEITMDSTATIDVDNDFTINQDGGDLIYIYMTSGTGDPQLLVDNDMILDHSGGTQFELEMNDASTTIIGRDVQFNTLFQNRQVLSLNDDSEFYIARNFVRQASPNNFGRLNALDNATVIYNGTGAQVFSEDAGAGADFFRYQNVIVNNTSGLLPAVTMESVDGGGATIYGDLTLTEGQVDINAERIFIDNTTPGAVTRTNGSVLSERTDNASTMEWQMDAVTGSHLFPFSTAAGEYIPLIFETTAGNIGKVDIATYETNSGASPNNLPYPTTPDNVTQVDMMGVDNSLNVVDRFWQIDKDGASGTATVTWTYTDTELGGNNTITENLLGAQRWNGSDWDPIIGSANAPANQVTATGITTFSPWVLVQNTTPLPVELLSFSGELVNGDVHLNWSTATEVNSDYFVVERSLDGTNFEEVDVVSAAGNSNSVIEYASTDENPLSGESYYRLRQVDKDGSEYFSDLVYIHVTDNVNEFDVVIYPNPKQHNENFYVQAHGIEEHVHITMIDTYGRTVYDQKVDVEASGHAVLHTNHLAAGVYTVYVSDGITQVVKRVVIR